MPIENPTQVNPAICETEGNGVLCAPCAVRLECAVDQADAEELGFIDRTAEWHKDNGTVCAECRAFATRRHPAMFSRVRTIQEIEEEITQLNSDNQFAHFERNWAMVSALLWVLGRERQQNGVVQA